VQELPVFLEAEQDFVRNRFTVFSMMLEVICSHVLTLPVDLSIPDGNGKLKLDE